MWNVINWVRKERTLILTTHSMEEAEALSTRVAIQIAGRFRCIGSMQHIKNKFGKGYEIEIKLIENTIESVSEYLEKYNFERKALITQNKLSDTLIQLNAIEYLE